MKKITRLTIFISLFILTSIFSSCSSFLLENVTYGWSSEIFINPDNSGNITIPKNSMTFNVSKLFTEEKITENPSGFKIRIIRDDEGYFFITADKFKFVWVFESAEKSLKLKNKLELVKDTPQSDPKFNEHKPNIEIFTKDGKKFILNKDGIVKNEEKKNEK
jgi:hypothetical protein